MSCFSDEKCFLVWNDLVLKILNSGMLGILRNWEPADLFIYLY